MQPSEANVAARMEDTWWENIKATGIKACNDLLIRWKSIKSQHARIFEGVHRFCIPVNKGKYCGQKGQGRQLRRIKYKMAKVKVIEVLSLGRQRNRSQFKVK